MSDPAVIALALHDVDEGVSCAGTSLESRTFRVGKKAFLFVSKEHLRLKLGPSIAEAKKRGVEVGANGWVKLALDDLPPLRLLKSWIAESHALFAGGSPTNSTRANARPGRGTKR